ncbi:MAG TPA: ABC-type transport auxiliary lipoprotein family protein [Planctomycetota bacterium]|nr:ABC-type transport auxiliary lipoprotein family protein [Planctomycetota bacterium]
MKKTLALAASLAATAACLSKSPVEPVRYFTPELPAAVPASEKTAPTQRATALWIRRVVASSHLDERMARRTSEVEIGFDDLRRWTEDPAVYVERALARELFDERGLVRSDAGRVPRLDVDVRAFEERTTPNRTASIAIAVSLLDAHGVALLDRTFSEQTSLSGDSPDALARAMGHSLAEVARSAAAAIDAALRAPR